MAANITNGIKVHHWTPKEEGKLRILHMNGMCQQDMSPRFAHIAPNLIEEKVGEFISQKNALGNYIYPFMWKYPWMVRLRELLEAHHTLGPNELMDLLKDDNELKNMLGGSATENTMRDRLATLTYRFPNFEGKICDAVDLRQLRDLKTPRVLRDWSLSDWILQMDSTAKLPESYDPSMVPKLFDPWMVENGLRHMEGLTQLATTEAPNATARTDFVLPEPEEIRAPGSARIIVPP